MDTSDKKELFYNICEDAARELSSQGGKLPYSDFWKLLDSLKGKYSFDGARSLNPVWWALKETGTVIYDAQHVIGSESNPIVISGNPIDGSFREKTAEYATAFEVRIA